MVKLTINNCSSTLVEDKQVSHLLMKANISSTEYKFLLPSKDDRADNPPPGYISVYKQQIKSGLRFPLHPLIVDICNRLEISPTQLRANSHCNIVGFILCAKLYDLPVTAECFFSLFRAGKSTELVLLNLHPISNFLERNLAKGGGGGGGDEWKTKFFFLRPVSKSWNCRSNWSKPLPWPKVDPVLKASFRESRLMYKSFRLDELIHKDLLVLGGIEQPGNTSPKFTFRYLMHKAAVTKFELQPEDLPPADTTNNPANERLVTPSSSYEDKVPLKELSHIQEVAHYKANRADLGSEEAHSLSTNASEVPINVTSSCSYEDKVSSHKQVDDDPASAHNKANCAELGSEEAQHHSTPPTLLALSKTLDLILVPKECYEKLEEEKQKVVSELTSTKSMVQELDQEIEQLKAQKIDSDYKTSQAMVKVKMLEGKLEEVKADSDCLLEKIKKDIIEEYKSSDDFPYAVEEEAVKYYVNGFDAFKLRLLNSGKLPSEFDFDFLDVADAECGNYPGAVDKAADDQGKKSLKRKKA